MAFGKTLKPAAPRKSNEDGTAQTFAWPFLNTSNGIRKLRILPELNVDNTLVMTPLLDPVGKPTKKLISVPETEVRWVEAWWSVMVDGNEQKRRFMLDPDDQWGSPLWKYIQKNFEKGSPERRLLKQRFGVNVIDLTAVKITEDGKIVYPDIKNIYNVPAYGSKRVDVVDEDIEAQPLMQVRIFEGSAGDEGGRHLFQQVADAADGLMDNDGLQVGLHQVTLILKTTGEKINTVRTIRQAGDFSKMPDELIYAPRYNIAKWVAPWPYEMIERAMDNEDFNALVEEYNISLYPELMRNSDVEAEAEVEKPVASKATTTKAKATSKAKQKSDDNDELFED